MKSAKFIRKPIQWTDNRPLVAALDRSRAEMIRRTGYQDPVLVDQIHFVDSMGGWLETVWEYELVPEREAERAGRVAALKRLLTG